MVRRPVHLTADGGEVGPTRPGGTDAVDLWWRHDVALLHRVLGVVALQDLVNAIQQKLVRVRLVRGLAEHATAGLVSITCLLLIRCVISDVSFVFFFFFLVL